MTSEVEGERFTTAPPGIANTNSWVFWMLEAGKRPQCNLIQVNRFDRDLQQQQPHPEPSTAKFGDGIGHGNFESK